MKKFNFGFAMDADDNMYIVTLRDSSLKGNKRPDKKFKIYASSVDEAKKKAIKLAGGSDTKVVSVE